MKEYVIRRMLIALIVLLGASMIIYSLTRSMPSDFVDLSTGSSLTMTDETRDNLRAIYGLDKGIVEGYFGWLWKTLHGDLGTSLMFKAPVTEIIKKYMPVTFAVAFISLILQFAIAIPLGILAAKKQYMFTDYLITTLVFLGISLPSFFFAALLKKWFGFYGLNILPVSGMLNARANYDGFSMAKLLDYARHLVLPITCFVITGAGSILRYTRTNMLESLSADYVRTARAKGVSEHKVVYSHAFRNTLIPIVTLLGASLPGLFSGAAITEGIFALEGLGNIGLKAAYSADVPYLMGYNMFLVLLTVIGFLLSDILYAAVDPRVRLH